MNIKGLVPDFIVNKWKERRLDGSIEAAAIFLDISGFTAMTRRLIAHGREGNEALGSVINDTFAPVIEAIHAHGGFVSSFAGDAVTALFESAKDAGGMQRSLDAAAACALAIKRIFTENHFRETPFGRFELNFRLGASCGNVEWHIIPNRLRHAFYFSGEAITGAAAAEHFCGHGGIAIDHDSRVRFKGFEFAENSGRFRHLVSTAHERSAGRAKAPENENDRMRAAKAFVPVQILNMREPGEFRDIVSCFASFDERCDAKSLIDSTITLAEEYGGYFNLADSGDKGGVMLVLFGAPLGRERLFERAAGFAAEVMRRSSEIEGSDLRIGMSFSTVYAGFVGCDERRAYTALGDGVNLSARLAMAAGTGETLIDERLKRALGELFGSCDEKRLKLKGFDQPVSAFALGERRGPVTPGAASGPLIGREKEVEELTAMLRPLKKGQNCGFIYIDGPAGCGKTRLASEMRMICEMDGTGWFDLRCDEILRKSFNPAAAFLKEYFAQRPGTRIAVAKDKPASSGGAAGNAQHRPDPFLAALMSFGPKHSTAGRLDAKATFDKTVSALVALFKAECMKRPCVIRIEDAHWIDDGMRAVLLELSKFIERMPLAIVCECRTADDGAICGEIIPGVPAHRIALQNLDARRTKKLIESKLTPGVPPLPERVLNYVTAKCGGSPFFAEQILAYAETAGWITRSRNFETVAFEIPSGIGPMITARLDRLGAALKDTACAAAVLGRTFEPRLLSAMLENIDGTRETAVAKAIDDGVRESIWEKGPSGRYSFRHALIRDGIYGMQLTARLTKLHAAAAAAICPSGRATASRYAELALHYDGAREYARALEYHLLAADSARENYRNDEAIRGYCRAEEIIVKNGDRLNLKDGAAMVAISVSLKKGKVLEVLSEWDEALKLYETALERAVASGDHALVSECATALGSVLAAKGGYERAMPLLERAAAEAGLAGPEEKRLLSTILGHIGYVQTCTGEYDRAIGSFKKKLALCRRLGQRLGESHAHGNIAIVHMRRGDHGKAMRCLKMQLAISEELGEIRTASVATGNIGNIHWFCKRYEKAMDCYKKQARICAKLGDRQGAATASGNMGIIHFMRNDFKKALRRFKAHLEACEAIGDMQGAAVAAGNVAETLERLGNYASSLEFYDRAISAERRLGLKYYLCLNLHGLARLHLAMKRPSDAAAAAKESLAIAKELDLRDDIAEIEKLLSELA